MLTCYCNIFTRLYIYGDTLEFELHKNKIYSIQLFSDDEAQKSATYRRRKKIRPCQVSSIDRTITQTFFTCILILFIRRKYLSLESFQQ